MSPKTSHGATGLGPGVDDSLGFLICDSARYVRRVLYARLAPYGIPGSCWFVLRVLWQRDGISQRELSERLGLAEPAVVMTLRGMERLDLVQRTRDETDRRRMRVCLTVRARTLEPELMAVAEDVNNTMLSALGGGNDAVVKACLRAIRGQLARSCEGVLPTSADDAATDLLGLLPASPK